MYRRLPAGKGRVDPKGGSDAGETPALRFFLTTRVSVVKTVSNFFRRNTCYHIVLFRLQRSEGGLIFAR